MITKTQVELWNDIAQQYNYKVKPVNDCTHVVVVSEETTDTFYVPEVFPDFVECEDYSFRVRAFKVSYSGFGTISDDRIEKLYWERLIKAHTMCEELNKTLKAEVK